MWSLHVWKESLENGNIAYTRELCDCPQPAYLSIAPLLLWCAKSLSWCHTAPLPKLAAVLWGSVRAGEPDWTRDKSAKAAGAVQDRERLQVSTGPGETTSSYNYSAAKEVWPYWDCSELVKRSRWQGQSDRLRQDTASMNIHCFDKRYRIHASFGIFFWLNVRPSAVLALSMGGWHKTFQLCISIATCIC